MKMFVKFVKVAQVGAGAAIFFVPLFMGRYRKQEEQWVMLFFLACLVLALVCPVFLWLCNERKRAWQGLVVTIVLAVLAAVLSTPQVIR